MINNNERIPKQMKKEEYFKTKLYNMLSNECQLDPSNVPITIPSLYTLKSSVTE